MSVVFAVNVHSVTYIVNETGKILALGFSVFYNAIKFKANVNIKHQSLSSI